MAGSRLRSSGERRKRERLPATCTCCRGEFAFCWRCRCGFSMCQTCMNENRWGMSCNGITWVCPDCGASNGYGNQ